MKREDKTWCGTCKTGYLERNNYFFGKLMTVRDFVAEQDYFNEKRWLINRLLNGSGVVCGLDVKRHNSDTNMIIVEPGLAIDGCGREIIVGTAQEIPLLSVESQCHTEQTMDKPLKREFVICLEYAECKTEAVEVGSIECCEKDKCEFNRIRDFFRITVWNKADVETQEPCQHFCPLRPDNKTKPLHDYLCEKLKEECPACPGRPCLILAEITVTPIITPGKGEQTDPGVPGYTMQIDQCSRRKLVYGNPLLYDLIECFHGNLPHVTDVSWRKEKKVNGAWWSYKEFQEMISGRRAAQGKNEDKKGLTVTFDKRMDPDTVNDHTFVVQVRLEDQETGNIRYDQVPGTISYDEASRTATFTFETEWINDIYLGHSWLREKGGELMVIIKGDFIMGCREDEKPAKALDGNFVGGQLPSGNGTQGGDFVSWFYVEAKPEKKKR